MARRDKAEQAAQGRVVACHDTIDSTRAHGLLAEGRNTKFCIVAEGATFGLRYSAARLLYGASARHDTTQGATTCTTASAGRAR